MKKAQGSANRPGPLPCIACLAAPRHRLVEMLGVTPRTLSRWDKAGILKFVRIGERIVGYNPETLEAFAHGEHATK